MNKKAAVPPHELMAWIARAKKADLNSGAEELEALELAGPKLFEDAQGELNCNRQQLDYIANLIDRVSYLAKRKASMDTTTFSRGQR